MSSQIISLAVTGVLSGGFVAAAAQFLSARNESRKLRLEEKDAIGRGDFQNAQKVNIAVEAAERSVMSLNIALNRAEKEIARLEHTITDLTTEVSGLRDEVHALRNDNKTLNEQLMNIRGY